MPVTITGDYAAVPIEDLIAPSVVVPTPGDLAQASVVRAAIQGVLDHLASAGNEIFNIRGFGVDRIKQVATIAAIKAIAPADRADGQLVLLMAANYSGGSSGLFSGVGLYVFVAASSAPESFVPGVPDAYLVIAPTTGSGRWVHVSVGLGFTLGAVPTFVPKPAPRIRPWHNEADAPADDSIAGAADTFHATDATLDTVLSTNETIIVDADFSLATNSDEPAFARLEVRVGAGAWTAVPGALKSIAPSNGSTNGPHHGLHLGAFYTAASNAGHDFRIAVKSKASQFSYFGNVWSFRALSFSPQLPPLGDSMSLLDRIFPWLGHGRYQASPPTLVDQAVAAFRLDALGRLLVTFEGEAAIAWTQVSSTGTYAVVRSSAGIVGGLYAASLVEDDTYLQLFNLAAGPPAGGATPAHVFPLVAGGVVSIEVLAGLSFSTGCVWAISSTPTTYTAVGGSPAHVIGKHRAP